MSTADSVIHPGISVDAADPAAPPMGAVQAAGAVQYFLQDQEIFGEGDDANGYFKVVSGVVRTCRFISGGRRQIDAFHVPGDLFGFEMGFHRSYCAEAASRATIILYRHRSMDASAATGEEFAYGLFAHAVRSLRRAQEHAVLLGRRTATERVAAFLIDWAANFPQEHDVLLAMTRHDIGDYLGLTVETVSRTLAQLERNAIIELCTPRRIKLTNQAALQSLAH